jgi:hypothetical protein
MSLIERERLLAEYDKAHVGPPGGARKLIEDAPTVKPEITLNDLLDLIDYNRESETEKIQICRPDSDWDDCDEVGTSSALLCPFGNAEVKCIGAVDENVIRVDIDWTGLFTLGKEAPHEP